MVNLKKFSIKTMENFVLAFFQVIPTTNVFQCTFYKLVFNIYIYTTSASHVNIFVLSVAV